MRRISALVVWLIVVLSTAHGAVDSSLRTGAAWLLQQQASDGGWHSTTYGQMSNGVGNTALILEALAQLPPSLRRDCDSSIDRGITFLLANLDPAGYVSAPQNAADYPLYATALLSRTLDRLPTERGRDQQSRIRTYLLATQRDGDDHDPLRGGWPQIGGQISDAHAERNVNVSISRFALEALADDLAKHPGARDKAISFLARCQNDDGGFCFLPLADDPLNKAGVNRAGIPRSYGTATADGILALLACGVAPKDPRVQGGLRWLESHDTIDGVPGIPDDQTALSGTRDALKFYYYAALASVMSRCRESPVVRRRGELITLLINQQRPDGSWANSNSLMREDDPLIATALAVSALATLRDFVPPE